DPCAAEAPAAWHPARRAVIEARLAASGADATRVVASIDARAAATAALRADSCLAARGPASDARARALRQQLCVDESWDEASVLFAGLEAADPSHVRAAVDQLIGVPPVDRCGRAAIPSVPPPPPAGDAAEVRAIEAASRAIRLDPSTTITDKLARVRALEPRIKRVAYPPLEAAWRNDLAAALAEAGDHGAARGELEASVRLAEVAGDDDARVRASINLLNHALVTGALDTAALVRTTEAIAERLGNPSMLVELRQTQAQLRIARGDLPGALAMLREASARLASIEIDAHPAAVRLAQNLGAAEQLAGELGAAQATLDRGVAIARRRFGDRDPRTLEIRGARATNLLASGDLAAARTELASVAEGLAAALGEQAPPVAQARGYLCELALEQRDPQAAEICDAALRSFEQVFGADSPQLAWPLTLAGRQRLAAERPGEAIALFERAVATTERGAIGPTERPTAQAYLALALRRARQQPERARELAAEALPQLRDEPSLRARRRAGTRALSEARIALAAGAPDRRYGRSMRTSFAFAAAVAASVGCTPTRQNLPPPPVEPPATEPPVTTVPAPATPGVQLPLVALHGYDVEDDAEPAISVSPTSLTVDGEEVLPLQGGLVARDARDVSREALIPALRDAFESQVARTGPPDRVLLAIDARTPYRTLFDAIYSTRSDEVQRFGLLARAGAHTVVAPIEA
ncbi:MAG: tetratricopeptide repeat protein, partial [Kofleriaceae bacterium]